MNPNRNAAVQSSRQRSKAYDEAMRLKQQQRQQASLCACVARRDAARVQREAQQAQSKAQTQPQTSLGQSTAQRTYPMYGSQRGSVAAAAAAAAALALNGPAKAATITSTEAAAQTVTATVTATATETETATMAATETQTATVTATQAATQTLTVTATATATETETATMTATETQTATVTAKQSATQTWTGTAAPAATQTAKATATQTLTATTTHTATLTSTATATATASAKDEEQQTELPLSLDRFSHLSDADFNEEYPKWVNKTGLDDEQQTKLRMDLIHCSNSTPLGKLLRKLCAYTALTRSEESTPLGVALQTLIAEFLYVHNCHYSLSAYRVEVPHWQWLPELEDQRQFRFNPEQLQQLLATICGEQLQLQLAPTLMRSYAEQRESLLMQLLRTLVASVQPVRITTEDATQTGKNVLAIPKLIKQLDNLAQLCAPPTEVISRLSFQKLMERESKARQQLIMAGVVLPPGQTALRLPKKPARVVIKRPQKQQQQQQDQDNMILSPVGPIQLPPEGVSVPPLPQLQPQQLANLTTVHQTLDRLRQPKAKEDQTVVDVVAGCLQTLSSVLQVAMQQKAAVGDREGFRRGYSDGFNHGHYMGVQEGIKGEQAKQAEQQKQAEQEMLEKQRQQEQKTKLEKRGKQELLEKQLELEKKSKLLMLEMLKQQAKKKPRLQDATVQTDLPIPRRAVGIQASDSGSRSRNRSRLEQRRPRSASKDATRPDDVAPKRRRSRSAPRNYQQWIHEMLHSRTGKYFLERLEVTLNRQLRQQKQRLQQLYELKLSQHLEQQQLSRRRSSLRTLCLHVEKQDGDSHSLSPEAGKLVQRLFQLLDHFEAHLQQLNERIRQTELAVEASERMQPSWAEVPGDRGDGPPSGVAGNVMATEAVEATAVAEGLGAGRTASAEGAVATPTMAAPQLSTTVAPLPATLGAPGALQDVLPPSETADCVPSVATHLPPSTAPSLAATLQTVPDLAASSPPAPVPSHAPPAAPVRPTSPPVTATVPSSTSTLAVPLPTSPSSTHSTVPTAVPPQPAPRVSRIDPPAANPLKLHASASTQTPHPPQPHIEPEATPPGHSFNEALVAARNRMQELEHESNLLEQSIMSYLEQARIEKVKLKMQAEKSRELIASLQSYRERHQRNEAPSPNCSHSDKESEQVQQPDITPITNAIASARKKLFSQLHVEPQAETEPEPLAETEPEPQSEPAPEYTLEEPWDLPNIQEKADELLSRVEASMARVNRFDSLKFFAETAQLILDIETSSTSDTLEADEPAVDPTAKLQQSMDRMNQLFAQPPPSQQEEQEQEQLRDKDKRPWSVPTVPALAGHQLAALRPHTAPSSLTNVATANSSYIRQLMDALGDTSDTSSTCAPSADAAQNPSSSSSTDSLTDPLLDSEAFWKRMQL